MKFKSPILILCFSLLLASCSNSKLPTIRDPETLQKDCAILFQQFSLEETNSIHRSLTHPFREITKDKWPVSIQKLNPFRVTKDRYAICIWILHNTMERGKNWEAKGYYVHENPNLSPPRFAHGGGGQFDLQYTSYKGIDIFYEPIAIL
jgi:hypothetical protein